MQITSIFKKTSRVQKYSLAALAFFSTNKSDASIIHTDVNPDEINFGYYFVDFDADGSYEFRMDNGYNTYDGIFEADASVWGNSESYGFIGDAFLREITPLEEGDLISWSGLFQNERGILANSLVYFGYWTNTGGQWHGVTDKYIGVRFELADGKHYGWIRCDVDIYARHTVIKEFAYETSPGVGILAGDRGNCVLGPQNPSHSIGAIDVTVYWDVITMSEACQLKGRRIVPPHLGPPTLVNQMIPEQDFKIIGNELLGNGTTWEWSVRCACSISPLNATPFSMVDTFSVPPLRSEENASKNISDKIQLSPNPAHLETILQVSETATRNLEVQILDLHGKLVDFIYLPKNTARLRLNVEYLPDGIYLIKVGNEDAVSLQVTH